MGGPGVQSDITGLGLKSLSIACIRSKCILQLARLYLIVCWVSCIVSVSTSKTYLVTTNCFVWWFLSKTTHKSENNSYTSPNSVTTGRVVLFLAVTEAMPASGSPV